jgi:uncharacterized ferritin-like protein (DUF455 family)
MELRERALKAFQAEPPEQKAQLALELQLSQTAIEVDPERRFVAPDQPGQPERPDLVDPKEVPRRSPFTPLGHAALMHSIAHIEFNAINLALDCIWRYPRMPEQFYLDWAKVAAEEARHFTLLSGHLEGLGHRYGDFPAHTGLWTVCRNTAEDIVARMALVPRTMEARGLDATPLVQAKLKKVGTPAALEACAVLDIILTEEVGHVAIGNHWYRWLCNRDQLDTDAFYAQAALRYAAPRPKPPFNYAARKAAGFTAAELQKLDHDASLNFPPSYRLQPT